jgi:hypothetical protein
MKNLILGEFLETSNFCLIYWMFYSLILHPVAREIKFNHLATRNRMQNQRIKCINANLAFSIKKWLRLVSK